MEVVKIMGKWSVMQGIGNTSTTDVVRPRDKTRSSVWPFSWVGPVMDRERLKESRNQGDVKNL